MKKQLSVCLLSLGLIGSSVVYAQQAQNPSQPANPSNPSAPAADPAPKKSILELNSDPHKVFDGSNILVRSRTQYDNAGTLTHNQGQYVGQIKMTLQLDQTGNLKVKALAETGPDQPKSFDSDPNNIGIGNGTHFENNLFLKQMYVDYTTGDHNVQMGSLSTVANKDLTGAFSIDSNGWINGARYRYAVDNEQHWMRDVTVTVGQMNEYDNAQIWNRDYTSAPNMIQVTVRGDLSKIVKYAVEGTGFEDDAYMRAVLDIAVKDMIKFVDSITIEEMIGTGNQVQQGFAVSLKKKLKSGLALQLQYSRKEDIIAAKGPQFLKLEDYYRPGDQITFKVEKTVNKAGTITPFVRASKTLNTPILDMNMGTRLEVGAKFTLPKKKAKTQKSF